MRDKCFVFRSRALGTCWDDTARSRARRLSRPPPGPSSEYACTDAPIEDVRGDLTKILEQADQGIPVAAENWTVAKFLACWPGHVVRPERKP